MNPWKVISKHAPPDPPNATKAIITRAMRMGVEMGEWATGRYAAKERKSVVHFEKVDITIS